MPMPNWIGQINKRLMNPMELKKGNRPVLQHVGRSSGNRYRVPLDAHPIEGGYLFILVYGSDSDWVQNILAAGTAVLEMDGNEIALTSPRVVTGDAAWQQLPSSTKTPPALLRIDELLQMDLAS